MKHSTQTCVSALPDGYVQIYKLSLQTDKRASLIVNGLALVLALAMLVLGQCCQPVRIAGSVKDVLFWVRLLVLLGGLLVYMVLHECVHGFFMKRFGAPQVKYGFTGMYAFAGSDSYFAKRPYIVIALAPIVIWGVVLAALCLLVPPSWFWPVYFIQVCNISGAAGDCYVTCKFAKMPRDILVQDEGVSMTVYAPAAREN